MTYTSNRLTALDSDILDTINGLIDRAAADEARRPDRPASTQTRTAYALISWIHGEPVVSEFGYGDKARDEALEMASSYAERFPWNIYALYSRTETTNRGEWSSCSS